MPLPKALPTKLETVGDHIRAARVRRRLEQGDVAKIVGVTECTVWNWENHRSCPPIHRCKQVVDFLGYNPFRDPDSFCDQLVSFRRLKGLRVKDAAALAGVDPASWSSWERGEHRITWACRERIQALLNS